MKRVTSFLAALVIACSAAACSQTDTGVTTAVKARFAQDDFLKVHEINVTTRDGVVTLTGEVESMDVKQQAVRIASETEGVTQVVDELRVEVAATGGELDDAVRETGEAIERGAEATADAARKAGKAVRDAVTDSDRDSDKDGK